LADGNTEEGRAAEVTASRSAGAESPSAARSQSSLPPLQGRPFQDRQVTANGLRFRVLEALPAESTGPVEDAPVALLLHGFPECAHSWTHQLPLLARLGYRAWAPDLRGYGQSERPQQVADYSIETLLADLKGWVDAAGGRPVLLIGHDWGAILSWYFTMRHPECVKKLVIMNVPHPACFAEQMHLRQFSKSWYAYFFQIPGLSEWLLGLRGPGWLPEMLRNTSRHPENFSREHLEPFVANARSERAVWAMLAYYRAALRQGGLQRQRKLGYPKIDAPTLVIWGEDDLALTKRVSFGVEEHVSALTQRYLPDASHWVQQDQPELVNQMLAAWLSGEEVPHAPGAHGDIG